MVSTPSFNQLSEIKGFFCGVQLIFIILTDVSLNSTLKVTSQILQLKNYLTVTSFKITVGTQPCQTPTIDKTRTVKELTHSIKCGADSSS